MRRPSTQSLIARDRQSVESCHVGLPYPASFMLRKVSPYMVPRKRSSAPRKRRSQQIYCGATLPWRPTWGGQMESSVPSIVDLNAELAKLTMFRRTPSSTAAERRGSVAQLATYRDGLALAIKASGTDHWERHLAGDELIHILDGTATL